MLIEITYNVIDVYMSTTETPVYVEISFEQPGGTSAVWGSITGTLSDQTDLQNALNAKFDDPTGTTAQYIRGDGSLATFPALTGYVPYTGATTNVNLGEYELKAGQVTLDTTPTGTAAVGTTRWNDTIGSSETTLKGGSVVLKNGVDLVARVVNKVTPNTTLTKAAYQAVRVSGAQGQRLAIALAQANNDTNSADTIGLVIETIPTNQEGFIMAVGQLEGINTTGSLQGETWVDGDVLYLSPTVAGAITNVKPTGAGHIVVIGYVEYAHQNNGKIYVKVMNGWELEELHDVDIVTPANNQGLFYESSTALWKNKSISTVLGYTPEQPLTFNSPLSRSVNAVSIPQATGSVNGFLSATDWTTFNSKQNALGFTPANASTTLTINGVTFDLSQNRTWTIAAGISGSGASGQVTYWTGASAVSGSNLLFWNTTNTNLGIGLQPQYTGTTAEIYGQTSRVSALFIKAAATGVSYPLVIAADASGRGFVIGQSSLTPTNFTTGGFQLNATSTGGSISAFTNINLGTEGTLFLQPGGGKTVLGSTTDNGQRLQVYGDTFLRGSGATSATTALTVQNSSSTNLFSVRNDGNTIVGTGTPTSFYLRGMAVSGTTGDIGLGVFNSSTTGTSGFTLGQSNTAFASFFKWGSAYVGNFAGSSIPFANASQFQSGSNNDLTFIFQGTPIVFNCGITATNIAARISTGSYRITTLANAHTDGTALFDLDASTTARASLRIRSGTAPTSPNDGDIWFDGTDIKMRIGGVTKTFTLV